MEVVGGLVKAIEYSINSMNQFQPRFCLKALATCVDILL